MTTLTITFIAYYTSLKIHILLFVGDLGLVGRLRSSRAGPGLPAVVKINGIIITSKDKQN